MKAAASVSVVPLFGSRTKRARVTDIIGNYVVVHQGADVGITVGTSFLPAGGFIAMLGAMGIQAPAIYQPMVREIAKTYLSSGDSATSAMLEDAAIEGGMYDIAATFGTEFMMEIAGELLSEAGIGAVLTFVPILGTLVAAYLDIKIAATMTWRVGIAAAIYFENGCEWLGDRKTTYERAKLLCGTLSKQQKNRYNLNHLQDDVPGLKDRQASLLERYLRQLISITGVDQAIDILLSEHQVNRDLVEELLLEVRGRRIDEGRQSAAGASSRGGADPVTVEKVQKFVAGMRAVGMSTGQIIRLGKQQNIDLDLLEALLLDGST